MAEATEKLNRKDQNQPGVWRVLMVTRFFAGVLILLVIGLVANDTPRATYREIWVRNVMAI